MTCPSSPPVTTVQPSLDTSMHRMAPAKVRMKNTTVVSYEKSFSKQRSSYKRLATFDIPKQLRGSLPKSGPLDFATKNTFALFFVGEEALVGVY